MERGTVRVKSLAQEHNTMSTVRGELGALDPKITEKITLAMRKPRLRVSKVIVFREK